MANTHAKPKPVLSKTQRRYKVGYVTDAAPRYTQRPSLHLRGDWLNAAEFTIGTDVTVKITEGCIILMTENNELQELRQQLYKMQQATKEIKKMMVV